jgi:hypothetical protein
MQYASEDDQRFFCVECGNAAVEGKWIAVKWPKNRPEIEEILKVRPKDNQNWLIGETAAALRKENQEHARELLMMRSGGR